MKIDEAVVKIVKDYFKNAEDFWNIAIKSGLFFWYFLIFTSFGIIYYWYESIPKNHKTGD